MVAAVKLKRTPSAWSTQPLRPLNSTEPETIPFDQRLAGPANLPASQSRAKQPSTVKLLASLGQQTSNLGQCGTASSVVPKESPCTVFWAATLQNFSNEQMCSPHTVRMQAQGEQLHQAHLVILCTVVYPHVCASGNILSPTTYYDHELCASVQTLCCVPLCTATQ